MILSFGKARAIAQMHARASSLAPEWGSVHRLCRTKKVSVPQGGFALGNDLGRIIKQQRISLSLTLQDLAAKSGVSSSHLGRIERGERFPSASILRKIANPLDFDESEMLTLAGFLSPRSSNTEGETRRLDPNVARLLAQESVEVQRIVIGLLSILKSLARVES